MASLFPPLHDGPPRRLRDSAAPAGSLAAQAGELIRAVPAPAGLSPGAEARVRAALVQPASTPGWGWRRGRLFAPVGALMAMAVTGFSALAALEWQRQTRSAAPIATTAPKSPPRLAPPPSPPVPPAALPRPPAAAAPALRRPPPALFTRARLAIDPRAEGYRPQVPPEFWRAHVGQHFKWKVKICVGPSGAVESATLLDRRHPALDREVARAMRSWRYRPALRAGQPVASCSSLVYDLAVEGATPNVLR